jgi:phage shock protein PspC (stress-responsive transcriptional regulator)
MENKKRSKKIIGGLCLAVSQKFNFPVVILRLVLVIISFFFFWVSVPIYVILWILQPFKSRHFPVQSIDTEDVDPTIEMSNRPFESSSKPTQTVVSALTILLFFSVIAFIGPVGIIAALVEFGDYIDHWDGFFLPKGAFLLNFYVLSASYNVFLAVLISTITWLTKKRQIPFIRLFEYSAYCHIIFTPFLLFSLFFTYASGGFETFTIIALPVYFLSVIGGYIIMFLLFKKKLKKYDPKQNTSSIKVPFLSFGIASAFLIGINIYSQQNDIRTKKIFDVFSYNHDSFSWGMFKVPKDKGAVNFSYHPYIKFEESSTIDTISIKLTDSYYNMYTEMDTVIPVNDRIVGLHKGRYDRFESNVLMISNGRDTVYRMHQNFKEILSIYTNPIKFDGTILNIMAQDIIQDDYKLLGKSSLEALVLGMPSAKKSLIFSNGENETIQIDSSGKVFIYVNQVRQEEDSIQENTSNNNREEVMVTAYETLYDGDKEQIIGYILEDVYFITNYYARSEFFDYKPFINENGLSILEKYQYVKDW